MTYPIPGPHARAALPVTPRRLLTSRPRARTQDPRLVLRCLFTQARLRPRQPRGRPRLVRARTASLPFHHPRPKPWGGAAAHHTKSLTISRLAQATGQGSRASVPSTGQWVGESTREARPPPRQGPTLTAPVTQPKPSLECSRLRYTLLDVLPAPDAPCGSPLLRGLALLSLWHSACASAAPPPIFYY